METIIKINNALFSRIKESDNILTYKKAQFTAYAAILFILLMIVLGLISTTYQDKTRIFQVMRLIFPIITVAFISAYSVAKGKPVLGAGIMAVGSCIFASAGFLTRPPHLAGVSLAYFMYLDLIYASFFCSAALSVIILIVFVTVQSFYFFAIAPGAAAGLISETAKTAYFDGVITLCCIYAIGFFTNRLMQQAMRQTEEDSKKNNDQLIYIRNLLGTIKSASDDLRESINLNSNLIDSYTENAQNQAASVEELTSTLEEISAGTENVALQTTDQNEALLKLTDCLNTLAMSIDLNELHSKEINSLFDTFVILAEKGKKASEELDITNKKISHNSAEVATVTGIIEDFFDRINLLALNASIEAARAGEYGRGFAVVADEISKLADTSQQQLKQISALIEKSRRDVEEGNSIIENILNFIQNLLLNFRQIQNKSLDAIQEINSQKELKHIMNERAEHVKEKSGIINISMQEQKIALNDIVSTVENTSQIVQKNAQNTELLRENSEKIRILAENLRTKFD